jgi:hypothetical protein
MLKKAVFVTASDSQCDSGNSDCSLGCCGFFMGGEGRDRAIDNGDAARRAEQLRERGELLSFPLRLANSGNSDCSQSCCGFYIGGRGRNRYHAIDNGDNDRKAEQLKLPSPSLSTVGCTYLRLLI